MGLTKVGVAAEVSGEDKYRQALQKINAVHKELNSEMKLTTATFANNANSQEALRVKTEVLSKQYDNQKQKVEVLNKALESNREYQRACADKIAGLKDALEQARAKMEQMSNTSGTTTEELNEQKEKVNALSKNLSDTEKSLEQAEKKEQSWKISLNNANTDLVKLNNEIQQNEKKMSEVEDATGKTADAVSEYSKEAKDASEMTSTFGDMLKANLVSDAIIAGVKAITGSLKDMSESAIEVGRSFSEKMSQVAATMGITTEEIAAGSTDFEMLSAAAKQAGATTKYSASEAAEGLNYLALAGYDAKTQTATLPKVLSLAAAGGMDLGTACDLVTDAMSAMSMTTEDLDTYVNQMARTAQKSNTSVSQLGEATLVVAGTATTANQSLTTMNTQLGILANNGIKGAEGGTHLRNIILSLSAPTDTASSALDKLGVKVSDSSGNIRDMQEVMVDLNEAMSGMSSEERIGIISKIFNKTDINAVNALLKGTGDEFTNLSKEIENSTGAADNMAATMQVGLAGEMDNLSSATEALGITVYEKFEKSFIKATHAATNGMTELNSEMSSGALGASVDKLANGFAELADSTIDFATDALPTMISGLAWILDNSKTIASGVAGIGAAIGVNKAAQGISAAVTAYKSYKTATEGATIAQYAFNAAQNATPAGLFVTALAGITTALTVYCVTHERAKTAAEESIEATKNTIEAYKQERDEVEKNIESRNQSLADIDTEVSGTQVLVDKLYELADSENNSNEKKIQMQALIEQINSTMPELNLAIDDTTGQLNKQKDAVDNLIESTNQSLKAQAAQEDLAEIANEQYATEKKIAEIKKKISEQNDIVKSSQEKLNKATQDYNKQVQSGQAQLAEYDRGMDSVKDDMAAAQVNIDAYNKELAAQQKVLDDLGVQFNETMGYISDTTTMSTAAESAAQMTGATVTWGDSVKQTTAAVADNFEKIKQEYAETKQEAEDSILKQIGLFEQYSTSCDLTGEQMISNLQQQADAMNGWADNLQFAARKGVDQGLLKQLADAGPESAGYLAQIVNMTDEEVAQLNDVYQNKLKAADYAADEMAKVQTNIVNAYNAISDNSQNVVAEANKTGHWYAEGFEEGFNNKWPTVYNTIKSNILGLTKGVNQVLQINSPSRVSMRTGEWYGKGFEVGTIDALNDADAAITDKLKSTNFLSAATSKQQDVLTNNDYSTRSNMINISVNTTGGVSEVDMSKLANMINKSLGAYY
mgnify:FL=1